MVYALQILDNITRILDVIHIVMYYYYILFNILFSQKKI